LRFVVVSGGGTGIGRATARAFAKSGDRVAILGRRGDVLERAAAELGAVAIQADLTDPAQVETAVASLPEVVDVLVNNAGGVPEIDVEGGALDGLGQLWDAVWRSNVVSAVLLTEALLPRLHRPGGRIVNLSSIAALRGNGAYGAAKAGIVAWTYSLAKRLGADGITANAGRARVRRGHRVLRRRDRAGAAAAARRRDARRAAGHTRGRGGDDPLPRLRGRQPHHRPGAPGERRRPPRAVAAAVL
jgi:NAD(P)-dependent dehydrogenase (short-subunit alcohol dehydrogenase family)